MFPHSLSFHPINTDQYSVSGDVTIFPGAAIAPGVLLQADVGSRIVIRAGVCVGLGSVIHATHGTITIHDGANLGAGVLLIGDVTIGSRACLGAAVTIINDSVEPRKILASGTVVGDRSRRESIDELIEAIPMNSPILNSPIPTPIPVPTHSSSTNSDFTASNFTIPNSTDANSISFSIPANPIPTSTNPVASPSISSLESTADRSAFGVSTSEAVSNSSPSDSSLENTDPTSIASNSIESNPIVSNPIVSTFKYPEPILEINQPSPVVDNSGKPWQSCDPNPWDPKDHPPGETTCQITSKPKDATPFNANLFSDQNYSSPYPPYPQPISTSTPTISTFVDPNPSPVPIESIKSETIKPEPPAPPIVEAPTEPKPIYGQDYVNRMLGKMSGRS